MEKHSLHCQKCGKFVSEKLYYSCGIHKMLCEKCTLISASSKMEKLGFKKENTHEIVSDLKIKNVIIFQVHAKI